MGMVKKRRPRVRKNVVSQEEFDAALIDVLNGMDAEDLLAVPGLYEVVAEQLNNDIIKEALAKRRW